MPLTQGYLDKICPRTQHVTKVCVVSSRLCWGGKGKHCKCKEHFWEKHLTNVAATRKLNWGGRHGGEGGGAAASPAQYAQEHRQGMPPTKVSQQFRRPPRLLVTPSQWALKRCGPGSNNGPRAGQGTGQCWGGDRAEGVGRLVKVSNNPPPECLVPRLSPLHLACCTGTGPRAARRHTHCLVRSATCRRSSRWEEPRR